MVAPPDGVSPGQFEWKCEGAIALQEGGGLVLGVGAATADPTVLAADPTPSATATAWQDDVMVTPTPETVRGMIQYDDGRVVAMPTPEPIPTKPKGGFYRVVPQRPTRYSDGREIPPPPLPEGVEAPPYHGRNRERVRPLGPTVGDVIDAIDAARGDR